MDKLQTLIDDKLESVFSNLKTWTPEERSQYCEDQGEHPLFSTSGGGGEGSPPPTEAAAAAFTAMRNVEYDELDDPLTLAMECKEKGNAAFKGGKAFYGHAVRHYQDAIRHAQYGLKGGQQQGGDDGDGLAPSPPPKALKQVLSTCHSNLAAIYLARGKYIRVVEECGAALRAWGDNSKAAWRAAKAAIALGRASSALELAEIGSCAGEGGEDAAASFAPLVKEARELLRVQEGHAAAARRLASERASSLAVVREACRERGIQVGPPLFNGMQRTTARPYVDEEGALHWPVVVLYPGAGQSDYVEDWVESGTLGELLGMVLPPPWDARGEYGVGGCDVFFKSNPCKPLPLEVAWSKAMEGEAPEESWGDVRWVLCPHEAPLVLPLMQPSYVVADLPVFYVVPRSSAFHAQMRQAAGGEFARLTIPKELLEGGGDA